MHSLMEDLAILVGLVGLVGIHRRRDHVAVVDLLSRIAISLENSMLRLITG